MSVVAINTSNTITSKLDKSTIYKNSRFETEKNNGSIFHIHNNKKYEYKNQCFWLSVFSGMKKCGITDMPNNVFELRVFVKKNIKDKNLGINKPEEQFDTITHHESLDFLTKKFELTINFFIVENNLISNIPDWIINEGSNIINIAFYGIHYELITNF